MPITLNPRVRFRAVGTEGVLVQIQDATVTVVNETGLRILQLIEQGITSCESMANVLQKEYEVPGDDARSDIEDYVAALSTQGIVIGQ